VDISIERRKYRRFEYEADISHDLLTHSKIFAGKIYNLSKGGFYFESDQTIYPGEDIFIKLENIKDYSGDDFLPQLPFDVKIIWYKDLQRSSFLHGYGAKYTDFNDSLSEIIHLPEFGQQKLHDNQAAADADPRNYPRRNYNRPLMIHYKNQNHRGVVTNISHGGAFIETQIKFPLGRKIVIVVPGSKFRPKAKLQGWVVRRNPQGFAVKFEIRSGRDLRAQLERNQREQPALTVERNRIEEMQIVTEIEKFFSSEW